MAREKVYRAIWENKARWKIQLDIIPAGLGTTTFDQTDPANIVMLPGEVVGQYSAGFLDAKFATGLPVGMVDVSTLDISFELAPLEEAHEYGFENPDDLVDLVDYLLNPTYTNGGSFTAGGIPGRTFDTHNVIRVYVSEGPFRQKFLLFDGLQEEVHEDQLVLGEFENFGIKIQCRSFWRVALEQITAADVHARFFDPASAFATAPALTSRVAVDLMGVSGGQRFGRITRYPHADQIKVGGTKYNRFEHTDFYTIEDLWEQVRVLCEVYLSQNSRRSGASLYLKSDIITGATPFDYVTLYQQSTTVVTGAKGTALTDMGDALLPLRSYLRHRKQHVSYVTAYTDYDPAAPIDETGGFLSQLANFGAGTMKSMWDVLQQCSEQSLIKVVPSVVNNDISLTFRKAFDNWIDETERFSDDAYTILRREISGVKTIGKRSSGNTTGDSRIYDLRDEFVSEAEAGMQEGEGDDKKTISYRKVGSEQSDGFDVPMMVHNLPRLGSKDKDFFGKPDGIDWGDSDKFPVGAGSMILQYDGAIWDSCIYYSHTLGGWTGRAEPVRVHENVSIDLGNGITETDTTSTPLSTETDPVRYKEETRTGVIETIQSSTGWPYWAARLYTEYFDEKRQGSLKFEVPGEHGLPEYLGEWFQIATDEGVSKGLAVWRDTPRLSAYPTRFALVETSLDFAITGTAQVRLWGSPHAEGVS